MLEVNYSTHTLEDTQINRLNILAAAAADCVPSASSLTTTLQKVKVTVAPVASLTRCIHESSRKKKRMMERVKKERTARLDLTTPEDIHFSMSGQGCVSIQTTIWQLWVKMVKILYHLLYHQSLANGAAENTPPKWKTSVFSFKLR